MEALKCELEALETDNKALESELDAFSMVNRGAKIQTRGLGNGQEDLEVGARALFYVYS